MRMHWKTCMKDNKNDCSRQDSQIITLQFRNKDQLPFKSKICLVAKCIINSQQPTFKANNWSHWNHQGSFNRQIMIQWSRISEISLVKSTNLFVFWERRLLSKWNLHKLPTVCKITFIIKTFWVIDQFNTQNRKFHEKNNSKLNRDSHGVLQSGNLSEIPKLLVVKAHSRNTPIDNKESNLKVRN